MSTNWIAAAAAIAAHRRKPRTPVNGPIRDAVVVDG